MKPCSNNRKLIALLAIDELDACQARELRAHLQSCEGCRRYLDEMWDVTKKLAARETAVEIKTSESFHRKVVARLRAEEKVSVWETIKAIPAMLNLRVALPVLAVVVALAVGLGIQHRQSSVVVSPPPAPKPVASAPAAGIASAPTIANYQIAVSQSLQTFDDLLTRQAKTPLPPAPIYTVSMLAVADAPE